MIMVRFLDDAAAKRETGKKYPGKWEKVSWENGKSIHGFGKKYPCVREKVFVCWRAAKPLNSRSTNCRVFLYRVVFTEFVSFSSFTGRSWRFRCFCGARAPKSETPTVLLPIHDVTSTLHACTPGIARSAMTTSVSTSAGSCPVPPLVALSLLWERSYSLASIPLLN
jgi:hypothetical protein